MAETNELSTQISNLVASPQKRNPTTDEMGRNRTMRFDFTQGADAGDAASTMELVKIPAGRTRVYLDKSLIAFSAFGAARTLDIGTSAYTDSAGVVVTADPDRFVDGLDVSSAGTAKLTGVIGGEESFLIDSREAVVIFATVLVDTVPAAATLNGYIEIVRD